MTFDIPALMAQLKLTAADVGRFYPIQEKLAQMREIASTYFGFINKLVGANLNITRKEAAIAYRASKFFPVREQLVRGMAPESVPAPELATVLQFGHGPWESQGRYRYDVVVRIDFGGKANVRDFPVQVFSRGPISIEAAMSQGIWKVMFGFAPESRPPDYGGTNKVMQISTIFEGFNMIVVK